MLAVVLTCPIVLTLYTNVNPTDQFDIHVSSDIKRLAQYLYLLKYIFVKQD
jgi:hypothetical protein